MFCMLETLLKPLHNNTEAFIIGFENRRLLLLDKRYVDVGKVHWRHTLHFQSVAVIKPDSTTNEFHLNATNMYIMWKIMSNWENVSEGSGKNYKSGARLVYRWVS